MPLTRLCFAIALTLLLAAAALADTTGFFAGSRKVSVNGGSFTVQMVRAPLGTYRVQIGLAHGRVGSTQSLAGIIQHYGAAAAINGCFFNAYTKSAIKPPYHNLITGGQLLHTGGVGVTLGFDAEGHYRMSPVRFTLQGSVNGQSNWPNNWYAYFINHPCETSSAAILYTNAWMSNTTPAQGTQVVVNDGVVQEVGPGSHTIPTNGYVLLFSGGEQSLVSRFAPGKPCAYKQTPSENTEEFWASAREALGCGPRLLDAGEVCVNPTAEGFSEAKILSMRAMRSAVGITKDNQLLLVTCARATVKELAGVMRALGAWDAMNLDGGASSSLWAQGKYLTKPGRDISNALMIMKR